MTVDSWRGHCFHGAGATRRGGGLQSRIEWVRLPSASWHGELKVRISSVREDHDLNQSLARCVFEQPQLPAGIPSLAVTECLRHDVSAKLRWGFNRNIRPLIQLPVGTTRNDDGPKVANVGRPTA